MDRTVCQHHNIPSQCQQCLAEIPSFLRQKQEADKWKAHYYEDTKGADREIATLRAHLTLAIDFAKRAGHLPGCAALYCIYGNGCCGIVESGRIHRKGDIFSHDFQPGKCTCGHDELLINAQPSPHLHALEQINTMLATQGAAALPEIALIVHKVLKK